MKQNTTIKKKEVKLTKKELRLIQMDYIQFMMVSRTFSGDIEMVKPLGWADEVRNGILEKIDNSIGKFDQKEFKKLLKPNVN